MRDLEQIEVVVAKLLSVKATGRTPIWAAIALVLWVSGLAFLYLFLGK